MTGFQHVNIPEGDLIETRDGGLVVGDRPIVGYLRGDGIGRDIAPVMRSVVEAAIERAYGTERRIAWCPIYAGLEGLQKYGTELPDEAILGSRPPQ